MAERQIEDAAERETLTHLFNDVLHDVRVKALPDEEVRTAKVDEEGKDKAGDSEDGR